MIATNDDPDKRKVLTLLWTAWETRTKLTQREIAREAFDLGQHEKEMEAGLPSKNAETTLRKVRAIIRDLRIEMSLPILSDVKGYWLPWNTAECMEYLSRMEREARAQAAAWYQTYRAMEQTVGVKSLFFEAQRSIFDAPEV